MIILASPPARRRSGLTELDLVLLGKGLVQGRKPLTRNQSETRADARDLRAAVRP